MMINKRLINSMNDSKKYIKIHMLMQWIALCMNILMVFTLGNALMDVYTKTMTIEKLQVSGFVVILSIFFRTICINKASMCSYYASKNVKHTLRDRIYKKLLQLGSTQVEGFSTSEIVQLSSEGVEQLENYFGGYLPQLFYSLFAPVTLFLVIAPINIKVASVLLVFVPCIPLSIIVVQKFAKKLLSKYWAKYTTLSDGFLENIQALTTLKIYQADEDKQLQMNADAESFRKITMKVLTMQLNSITLMDLIAYGGSALGIVLTLYSFKLNEINLAQAFVLILLSAEFFLPLRQLGSYFHIAMNGMASSEKIFKLLDLPEIEWGYEEVLDEPIQIKLENISFSYGEKEVVEHISATIEIGKYLAIVGESGSGKSTLASLLLRENRCSSGVIRINGVAIEEIQRKSLMRKISLTKFNSVIFKGTVKTNLMFANEYASESSMWSVLEQVDLKKHFENEDGLDTKINERGSNLSGGQAQRLALARSILHDSEVMIFDEITSNIDVESEERINGVIAELAKTKAVVVITHKLTQIQNADEILVLSKGRVIESGTHASLMMLDGCYKKYWDAQTEIESFALEV